MYTYYLELPFICEYASSFIVLNPTQWHAKGLEITCLNTVAWGLSHWGGQADWRSGLFMMNIFAYFVLSMHITLKCMVQLSKLLYLFALCFTCPLLMPFCCWKIELSRWTRDVLPSAFSAEIFHYSLLIGVHCDVPHRARSILGTGVCREAAESLSNTPLPISLSAALYTSSGKGDHISFCLFDLSVKSSQKKFSLRSCWRWICG